LSHTLETTQYSPEMTDSLPPPQWVVELSSPPVAKKTTGIPDPLGFTATTVGGKVSYICSQIKGLLTKSPQKQQPSSKATVRAPPTTAEMDVLKLKKAWEVALAPVKQLPMTAIMMYMSGNSLQIFSIMMVVMAFKNPLVGLMATNQAFEKFETEGTKQNILMVKAVYVAMQILALALGVWKVNGMGLLPYVQMFGI
jgi:hypothetical protein